MQEPVYVLHLITCHGRIMPRLAELLLKKILQKLQKFVILFKIIELSHQNSCFHTFHLSCMLLFRYQHSAYLSQSFTMKK